MKNLATSALLLCALLGTLAAQDEGEAISRVLALEHAWNQAEERKDTRSLDVILDASLVYVDYDGSLLTKSEFLKRLAATKWQPELETTEAMSGHMFGGTVIVTGLYSNKGVENGKPYTRRGRFVDSWSMKAGNWVCIASQATPIGH